MRCPKPCCARTKSPIETAEKANYAPTKSPIGAPTLSGMPSGSPVRPMMPPAACTMHVHRRTLRERPVWAKGGNVDVQ